MEVKFMCVYMIVSVYVHMLARIYACVRVSTPVLVYVLIGNVYAVPLTLCVLQCFNVADMAVPRENRQAPVGECHDVCFH